MLGFCKFIISRSYSNKADKFNIYVGNFLPAGGGVGVARMVELYAGIPVETHFNTINRQCSPDLTSVNQIANQITVG